MPKKCKKYFVSLKQISKCDKVLKLYIFNYFYTLRTFNCPVPYLTQCMKRKLQKKSLKAGGSKTMYSLGGVPWKKALENRYRVSMCYGGLKKMPKKCKKYIFCLKQYQYVTHISTSISQGLFKNIDLRSVALVTKQL